MNLSFFITDRFGNRVPVHIRPARQEDFHQTKTDHWQTKWTSNYIQNPEHERFAMKVAATGELVGLLACKPLPKDNCLRLIYMEAAPHSNPTLVKRENKKYNGVGRAFLAQGIAYFLKQVCRF